MAVSLQLGKVSGRIGGISGVLRKFGSGKFLLSLLSISVLSPPNSSSFGFWCLL